MVKLKSGGAESSAIRFTRPFARATPTLTVSTGFLDEARKRRAVECSESTRQVLFSAGAGATKINPLTATKVTKANFFNISCIPILYEVVCRQLRLALMLSIECQTQLQNTALVHLLEQLGI